MVGRHYGAAPAALVVLGRTGEGGGRSGAWAFHAVQYTHIYPPLPVLPAAGVGLQHPSQCPARCAGPTLTPALSHPYYIVLQVAYIAVEAGAVPQLRPGALPPHATRLQPFVTMAGRCLLLTALLERRTLGGVAAGTVRDAVGLAGALLALGAARTLQVHAAGGDWIRLRRPGLLEARG